MINIPNKTTPPLCRANIGSLNSKHTGPLSKNTIGSINKSGHGSGSAPVQAQQRNTSCVPSSNSGVQQSPGSLNQVSQTAISDMTVPAMHRLLRKGQKTSLPSLDRNIAGIKACFGWNIRDARCDVDASAFLVKADGRVPGDDWFVFYGQEKSPDGSVSLSSDTGGMDRKVIHVDLRKLNSSIQKIVFVVTIHEAFEKNLNFSMLKDTYIRLLDADTGQEIFSYCLEEYYQNVTSMTIGELYLYNGQWKFNPVGNGVNRDLAGQCAVYGVEIG
jgi:tellurium resistance protein TerD